MKDFTLGDTLDFKFTTCEPDTGAPITLAGSPVISAYVDNSTTEITAGITLTVDFDGRTGLHNVRVVASGGNGFATGTSVALIITTGTVDGVSAVGYKVAEFTLGRAVTANVAQWHGSDLLTGTGPLAGLGVLDRGTAQADSTTTITLRAAAAFADDELNGATALLYSATTGAGQRRLISDYAGATDVATLESALVTDPTGTLRYEIYGTAPSSGGSGLDAAGMRAALGMASANLDAQLLLAYRAIMHSGTAQAGAANTITLAVGASATDNLYDPSMIRITGGTGVGQSRIVIGYNGTSKVATVDRDWRTNPDATSTYEITPAENLASTNEGAAQAGAASTITLNSTASATDNFYVGQLVVLRSGTGQDQARVIIGYVGSTRVATVDSAWATNPAAGTGYAVLPVSRSYVASIIANAITAAAINAAAITAAKFGADAIDANALAATAATEIATALQTQALNTGTAGSVGERLGRVPNVAAGASGGLPTLNANLHVAADVIRMGGTVLLGNGTSGNLWRGS